tara:strand:+ start:705 stop:1916 length:1212 start_codon:yes stop_codon:yes gene_type:complete
MTTENSQFLLFFTAVFVSNALIAAPQESGEVSIEYLASPAPENSALSRVVSDKSGRIYLSWVNREGDSARFEYSKLMDSGWSNPETISEGHDWFVNWADFPMLSVNAGNMAAHWLRMSADGTYDYNIEASFFVAGTRNWSEARIIHNDGVNAEHGFVSMLPMDGGSTMFTWLDGRNTKLEEAYGEMTLRAGVFDAAGKKLDEWELDHRVCDCCQTSSAITAKGPLIVYRDRSDSEVRDISIVRYIDGSWTAPLPVHDDGWQISGCPVNGPSVSADDNRVAVSWFTAKDDIPKVLLALSNDAGETFTSPLTVSSINTNGRVGTAILDNGNVVVSWIDTAEEARIMLSLYSAVGAFVGSYEIADTSASRRSGFPIIEGVGNSVYISWTDVSAASQVRIARLVSGN